MFGGGGEPSMNTVPTYRHGRKYYTPGPNDRGGCAGVCSVLVTLILLAIPPIFFIGSEALRYKTYVTLTSALESGIQPLSSSSQLKNNIGDIVHATTSSIETTASDPDMSLYVPGALALRRKTEYCQWQELRRENCQTCTRTVTAKDGTTKEESYKCDCVTSFDYVKTWRSHRINSLVFDQPAAHNNPQRDPLPSVTLPAPSASIEVEDNETGKIFKATLQTGMLSNVRATWRKINFVHGGVPPPPSWFASFFVKWIPDKTRYEDTAALSNIGKSLGATKYNFVYVGQGGYFFSPYQEDKYATLFKYFMEYVEDSLFDWQVGDLMPSCTAGDVRFYYEVVDPAVISIVGEVKEPVKGAEQKGRVQIGPWQTEDGGGMTLGLVHAGEVDAETMIAIEDSDSLWKTLLPRFVLLIWSIAMSRLLGALFGTGIAESQFITQLSATFGLWFGIVSIVWYVYWGKSIDGTFLLLGSIVLMTLAFQQAPKSATGGFRAMWNMIGRWANVPPHWRVEDTYDESVVGEVGYEDPKKKVP